MARRLLATCSTLLLAYQAVADNFPFATYNTEYFTPPDIEVIKSGETDGGYIFVGPRGNAQAGTAALIYDENGDLVYQGPQEVAANFKVQKLYNEDVITFWAGDMMELGYGYGAVHILDNTYREMYTVTLNDPTLLTPDGIPRASYIDLHESQITERNTLLVCCYNVTQADLTSLGGWDGEYMLDSLFYEIDIATNEIIYSWSALEAGIPVARSRQVVGDDVGVQSHPYDVYHINSVALMPEGYIISLRMYWSGFYIHSNGSVLWQLSGENGEGDFVLDDAALFSWQHDIRVYNHTEEGFVMNLFNNANTPTEMGLPSSGLSLYVDLGTHRVSALRDLKDPEDEVHSMTQGSYQLMDPVTSHVFIDYGSIAKAKEFDGDDNEVLTVRFGQENAVASYRGYKCQWKAQPFWKPSVVARRSSTTTRVYVSWNGATEYDNVAVYSVSSPSYTEKTLLATHHRTGFETRIDVQELADYIVVVAQKGDIPLSISDATPIYREGSLPVDAGNIPYS